MSDRDPELDDLLAPLAGRISSPENMQRWSAAVDRAVAKPARFQSPWWLLAAMLVGFVLGAVVMRAQSQFQNDDAEKVVENFSDDGATIVHVTAKSY